MDEYHNRRCCECHTRRQNPSDSTHCAAFCSRFAQQQTRSISVQFSLPSIWRSMLSTYMTLSSGNAFLMNLLCILCSKNDPYTEDVTCLLWNIIQLADKPTKTSSLWQFLLRGWSWTNRPWVHQAVRNISFNGVDNIKSPALKYWNVYKGLIAQTCMSLCLSVSLRQEVAYLPFCVNGDITWCWKSRKSFSRSVRLAYVR
jgi:hypothetical protein